MCYNLYSQWTPDIMPSMVGYEVSFESILRKFRHFEIGLDSLFIANIPMEELVIMKSFVWYQMISPYMRYPSKYYKLSI